MLPKRIYLTLAIGILAVSSEAIFIRYTQAPGLIVAAYRMLFVSLFLLPLTLPTLKRTPLSKHSRGYTLLGGVFLGIGFSTWISSLSYTTVTASAAMMATQPVWVALFGWFFLGIAPSFMMLLGVLVTVAGGAIISFSDFPGGSAPLLGDFLALMGALSFSAYLLLGRSAQKRGLGLNAYVGVANLVAAFVVFPLPFMTGLPYPQSYQTFVWIALIALIPQLLGRTSINTALLHLNPTVVVTAMLLEPILASLLASFLFKENPSQTTFLGAMVLLIGVGITIYFSQMTKPVNKK